MRVNLSVSFCKDNGNSQTKMYSEVTFRIWGSSERRKSSFKLNVFKSKVAFVYKINHFIRMIQNTFLRPSSRALGPLAANSSLTAAWRTVSMKWTLPEDWLPSAWAVTTVEFCSAPFSFLETHLKSMPVWNPSERHCHRSGTGSRRGLVKKCRVVGLWSHKLGSSQYSCMFLLSTSPNCIFWTPECQNPENYKTHKKVRKGY